MFALNTGRSERSLPEISLEQDIAVEQLERRLASIESSQRHSAQCAAAETQRINLYAQGIDELNAKIDRLSSGLVDNVLAPIHDLREAVEFNHTNLNNT